MLVGLKREGGEVNHKLAHAILKHGLYSKPEETDSLSLFQATVMAHGSNDFA